MFQQETETFYGETSVLGSAWNTIDWSLQNIMLLIIRHGYQQERLLPPLLSFPQAPPVAWELAEGLPSVCPCLGVVCRPSRRTETEAQPRSFEYTSGLNISYFRIFEFNFITNNLRWGREGARYRDRWIYRLDIGTAVKVRTIVSFYLVI